MTATPTRPSPVAGHAPGGIPFVKGHGTENDFILLPDPQGMLTITTSQVRAICDRRAGIGADGVIRVARAAGGGAPFEMDYRNADGTYAEMCGNGARVFARFLVDAGWTEPGGFDFVTRGGVRSARLDATGDISIGMGPATVGPRSWAGVLEDRFTGTAVDVGNPHLVCLLDQGGPADPAALEVLATLDLTTAPTVDPDQFPDGVNVEFVVVLAPDHIRMRVFERGVGETRSCGTGTVAAAAAFLTASGSAVGQVRVDVPGGSVVVSVDDDDSVLTGPAVLVGAGTIDQDFWDTHR